MDNSNHIHEGKKMDHSQPEQHDNQMSHENHAGSKPAMENEKQKNHIGNDKPQKHARHEDHAIMVADYRKRFFVSLILMVPILLLAALNICIEVCVL